jgi:kynurenine formamidase
MAWKTVMGKTLIYIYLFKNVHLAYLFIEQVDNEKKVSSFCHHHLWLKQGVIIYEHLQLKHSEKK